MRPEGLSAPVLLAVDVEPDDRDRPPGSGVAVDGFEGTVDALERLRGPLSDATGSLVQFAWFVRIDRRSSG
jgi:hypothetical protein